MENHKQEITAHGADKILWFEKDGIKYSICKAQYASCWNPANGKGEIATLNTLIGGAGRVIYTTKSQQDLIRVMEKLHYFFVKYYDQLPMKLPDDFFTRLNRNE